MKTKNQQGQILLITIMLLAAAVTVVMTIAFNSTTETQITKLEEDSQKALSAAESALEAALQQKGAVTIGSGVLQNFQNTGITGQADVVNQAGLEFVTPLLQRDEQYTLYLANYDPKTNLFSASWPPSPPGNLSIYIKSETDCPALELTFIDNTNNVQKNIIDPCNVITGLNKITMTNLSVESVGGTAFKWKTSPSISISNKKVVIARVLNAPTKIGFSGNGVSLPPQGNVVTSEAKTQTGATKKIELFQSYPQIPSDFFVTGF